MLRKLKTDECKELKPNLHIHIFINIRIKHASYNFNNILKKSHNIEITPPYWRDSINKKMQLFKV